MFLSPAKNFFFKKKKKKKSTSANILVISDQIRSPDIETRPDAHCEISYEGR